jgi:(R)-2-hydroxyacyl-CoA dehydratese activating ATPase
MMYAGLDIGSRTIVLVEFAGEIRDFRIVDAGPNPLQRCESLLDGRSYQRLVATGYGRRLAAGTLADGIVSEIRAYALGARHLYPDCRTVIDVGGQDCKASRLSETGDVERFEMNDRCAAGTGAFLEAMARTLEVPIEKLGEHALAADTPVRINSLCTVFAQSEVVSLVARGADSRAIALGVHEAIATRVGGMARRVRPSVRIVFAGGGALNPCLRQLLSQKLGVELTVPEEPQVVGALGAALVAREKWTRRDRL